MRIMVKEIHTFFFALVLFHLQSETSEPDRSNATATSDLAVGGSAAGQAQLPVLGKLRSSPLTAST